MSVTESPEAGRNLRGFLISEQTRMIGMAAGERERAVERAHGETMNWLRIGQRVWWADANWDGDAPVLHTGIVTRVFPGRWTAEVSVINGYGAKPHAPRRIVWEASALSPNREGALKRTGRREPAMAAR